MVLASSLEDLQFSLESFGMAERGVFLYYFPCVLVFPLESRQGLVEVSVLVSGKTVVSDSSWLGD